MKNIEQPTILIIDDEFMIRESYCSYLEDMNYHVLMAENGKEGIELFDKEGADLILLDLRMPEMDGLEVLKSLKKIAPAIPTIVVSGTKSINDAVEALNLGAWSYLQKPIEDMSVLLHALTSALEKAKLIKENKQYQEDLEKMVSQRTKELEKAFKEAENSKIQFERVLDDIQTGIMIVEIATKEILYVNPFAADMIGIEAHQIIGKVCSGILCPGETKNCPMLNQKKNMSALEQILTKADGTEIPILKTINYTPYYGKQCLLESFIDLTLQKKASIEKERLELQLRQAQKLESIGILVC
ncbi:MAG: response regulator [Spirochaetales bacterium]|nr:response regulator [Spirochaetales bacterium]